MRLEQHEKNKLQQIKSMTQCLDVYCRMREKHSKMLLDFHLQTVRQAQTKALTTLTAKRDT